MSAARHRATSKLCIVVYLMFKECVLWIISNVVEVFVKGKQCVAMRVYPGLTDSVGVSLRSQGRDAELKSLDAWQMKNIYA